MADLENLKKLLKKEKYPFEFTFKFVGKASGSFENGVSKLEIENPKLKLKTRRLTANQRHTSLTYLFQAENAEAILEVYNAIGKIDDLVLVL